MFEQRRRLKRIWKKMHERCSINASGPKSKYYFESGVRVCESWSDFECFFKWSTDHGFCIGLSIDRKDNAKGYSPENCRWANRFQQSQNQRKRSDAKTSRFKGVHQSNGRWKSVICANGKCIFLGRFESEVAAAIAYNNAANELHGEYAVLNVVSN